MNVKKFKFNSGESYSILMGDNGLPMDYPNLFMTINHRNASDATSTCHANFEHIKYLYEICTFLNIDIEERCKRGDFVLRTELETLIKWAKRTVPSFREHVARNKGKNIVEFTPRRNKLESARQIIVVEDEKDISSHTSYNRITTFASYIGWLEQYLFPSKIGKTKELLKSLRPKKFSAEGDIERDERIIDHLNKDSAYTGIESDDYDDMGKYKSLTRIQIIRILDVIRPDSSDNPWVGVDARYRNQLIINMLEAIGNRRGELARIRIQDIKTSTKNGRRYLSIRKNSDLNDKRADTPSAKTLGRLVPIDSRLSEMIDNYIINHRSNIQDVGKIPYLFVTHHHRVKKPNALSMGAVNKICRQVSKVVGFRVHPHAFRHSWNDRYSDNADRRIKEGKVTHAKSESDRQKLMGWREGSDSGKKYSMRHDDERAILTGLELQEKNSTEIMSIVGAYDEDIPM